MQFHLETFRRIKKAHAEKWRASEVLICKVGRYMDSAVIKLQKSHWTNDSMNQLPNTMGIYFSLWVDERSEKQDRLLYNIEARRIRTLAGYNIDNANRFAGEFRERFKSHMHRWPNVEIPAGPGVLMMGSIEIRESSFENDSLRLMRKFVPLSKVIDSLLASRKQK